MKKKILLSTLGLLLAVSLVAIGCPAPAPTPPAPTPAPAPAPAPAPEVKIITWRYSIVNPPTAPSSIKVNKALDAVEQKSQGRLKIERHYGGELGITSSEYAEVVEKGQLECAVIPQGIAKHYPWMAIGGVPFLCPEHAVRQAMWEAIEPMYDEFCKEHGIVPLAYFVHEDPWLVLYSTREIKSLSDCEGMLIRCYNVGTRMFAEGIGGIPTAMEKSAVYAGLEKGTVDGAVTGISSAKAWHYDEVCKFVMKLWPTFQPNIIGVNKASWDRLPEDLQKIARDVFVEWEKDYWHSVNDPVEQGKAFDYAITHGMTVFDPPSDVRAVFPAIRERAIEQMISEGGEKAKRVLDLVEPAIK